MDTQNQIQQLLKETSEMTPPQIMAYAFRHFKERVTFASSLGEEDQVITDMIAKNSPEMEIFTLDTGRLFQETLELIAKNQKKYPMPFKVYFPDNEAVEDMVANHGINLFYESVANRKLCCGVRKVEPLRRALAEKDAWITGIRRGQSITRQETQTFEWDEANQKIKINPLAHWSLDQVRQYIQENNVDVNPLHQQGFISIGCSCCTRAVKAGEDIRAGRWWWEQPQQRECGLHNNPNRQRSEGQ